MKIKLNELVKKIRTALGESQEVFGFRWDVSHASVSDWETGRSNIPNKVIEFCLYMSEYAEKDTPPAYIIKPDLHANVQSMQYELVGKLYSLSATTLLNRNIENLAKDLGKWFASYMEFAYKTASREALEDLRSLLVKEPVVTLDGQPMYSLDVKSYFQLLRKWETKLITDKYSNDKSKGV